MPTVPGLHGRDFVELLANGAEFDVPEPAYTWLEDGGATERHLAVRDLHLRACAIAAHLRERGLEGAPVLLLYPPGLDFVAGFFGCLYARTIAVPTYPPDPSRLQRSLPRLRALVADAGARAVLCTAMVESLAAMEGDAFQALEGLPWISTDSIPEGYGSAFRPEPPGPGQLAFIQYTSGSTGDPRGVMVSHGNLVANEGMIYQGFGAPPRWRGR